MSEVLVTPDNGGVQSVESRVPHLSQLPDRGEGKMGEREEAVREHKGGKHPSTFEVITPSSSDLPPVVWCAKLSPSPSPLPVISRRSPQAVSLPG